MGRILTIKEHERMSEEYAKVRHYCKCGHSVIVPEWVDKQLCKWCGSYVFKTKEDEFKYRMKEKMKK